MIVLKCLDDDGQKRPEDIKKVKESAMLCFCKDENENNFEIYVNAEIEWNWEFYSLRTGQGNQDLYKEWLTDEQYLSSTKCDFSMLSNESLKNKKNFWKIWNKMSWLISKKIGSQNVLWWKRIYKFVSTIITWLVSVPIL